MVTRSAAARRLRRMHDQLFTAYGPQHWWPAESRFEVVLGAYLVQNTSWQAVERALDRLRGAGLLSLEGVRATAVEELRELIRPAGFVRRKGPALKSFVKMLDEEFCGSLEALGALPQATARARLLALPGVGPETADAICLYALGQPVPVADEYMRRIVERHGLLTPAPGGNRPGYEALAGLARAAFAEDAFERQVEHYNEFHALMVSVGKRHCGRVPQCQGCPLVGDLEWAREGGVLLKRARRDA